jgi:hypothetical protein
MRRAMLVAEILQETEKEKPAQSRQQGHKQNECKRAPSQCAQLNTHTLLCRCSVKCPFRFSSLLS